MHDYTVQRIHDDRMRDLEREADRSAVAAIARQGRQRQGFRVGASRWLTALLAWPSGGGGRNTEPDSLGGGLRSPAHAELGEDI